MHREVDVGSARTSRSISDDNMVEMLPNIGERRSPGRPEMGSQKKLTDAEFEEIRPHLSQMKARSIDIAKAVLVDGKKQVDLAHLHQISTKAVSQMVIAVWNVFVERGSRPEGWVQLNVALPPEMAAVVKQMENAAVKAAQESKK